MLLFLKFIWEQFCVDCRRSRNLKLPWEPYFERLIFLKLNVLVAINKVNFHVLHPSKFLIS